MNLNISKTIKNIGRSIGKYSPEILVGFGVVGMISSIGLAIQETPKAVEIIKLEEARREEHDFGIESDADDIDAVPVKDVIRLTWKCYIPAVVTGGLSTTCLIGASSVNARRNAALATAYTISESALKDYQEKVVEVIGEKKEKAVQEAVIKEKLERNPVRNNEVIITEKGNTLCYDSISGRYFKSDIDAIKSAINDLNRDMLTEMFISLNDLYYALGLQIVAIGNQLGWKIEDGLIDIYFTSQLAEDGTPCLVLEYDVIPRYR